uniref:tektin-1-like n=1 Tax=Myxine glutinosa TaxID=7769 RepID=UPI00358EA6C0
MGTNGRSRCSETSWHGVWAAAGQRCVQSQWLRNRAERLVQETAEVAGTQRAERVHCLEERERSLYFWRQQFISRASALEEEAKRLLDSHLRVQHANRTSAHPLDVVRRCIEHRAAQGGCEAGKKVQSELQRELEIVETAQNVLHEIEQQLTEQIRCNRAMWRALDRDLSGKMTTLELETRAIHVILKDSEQGQMEQAQVQGQNGGLAEGRSNLGENGCVPILCVLFCLLGVDNDYFRTR